MLDGGEYLRILITRRQRLVLNLGTLPLPWRPHSFCSETHCRGVSPCDGWERWPVALPTVDQFFIPQTHSIIVEYLPACPPLLSHSAVAAAAASSTITHPQPCQKRHLLIAQLHHIIGMLVMVSVPSSLAALTWSFAMRNYRPGAKAWPQRLSSTVLIVSPSALAWRSQLTV